MIPCLCSQSIHVSSYDNRYGKGLSEYNFVTKGMDALNKGTNLLGSFYMWRNFFIGLFLTCILCLIGGFLSTRKYKRFTSVEANISKILSKDKIIESTRTKKQSGTTVSYVYELEIKYKPITVETYEEPTECPEGMTLNSQGECVTAPTECPEGMIFNSQGECVTADEDEVITKTFQYTTSKTLSVNDTITIEYDPDDPTNIRSPTGDPKIVGYVLLGIGTGVCMGTLISTYVLSKSKTARQIYGTTSAVSNVRDMFD